MASTDHIRGGVKLRFDILDINESFSSISVSTLHQDQQGFIWIGTQDGLYRYDGYQLKEFRHHTQDESSIQNNAIQSIHEDKAGLLWVGTNQGVSTFDPEYGKFTNHLINGEITPCVGMAADSDGSLFVITDRGLLCKYNEQQKTFDAVSLSIFGIVHSFFIDSKDRLWIGNNTGVVLVSKRYGIEETIPITSSEPTSDSDNIEVITEGPQGRIWFGTNGKGCFIYDPTSRQLKRVPGEDPREKIVRSIVFTREGEALLGTTLGLVITNLDLEQRHYYPWDETRRLSIQQGTVNAMLLDHQGNLWAGTSRGGVSIITNGKAFNEWSHWILDPNSLSKEKVTMIARDKLERVWVGYHNDGVDMFSPDLSMKTTFDPLKTSKEGIGLGSVWALSHARDGKVWIGTSRSGLQLLDPSTGIAKHFNNVPDDPESIMGDDVRCIVEDPNGGLWLSIHGKGVDYFDPDSGDFTHFSSFASAWIEDMLLDDQGQLWVSHHAGVEIVHHQRGIVSSFTHVPDSPHSLSNQEVLCLFQDRLGRIWAGTLDGLNQYDPSINGFIRYGSEQGIIDSSIRSIEDDAKGRLWLGTGKGLLRWNPSNHEAHLFTKADGLRSNELVARSSHQDDDGKLYFGSERGICSFYPNAIRLNQHAPQVYITGLSVFNQHILPSDDTDILEKSLSYAKNIELPPGMNSLSFEFVAINYISTENNQYAYQLEGFDNDWIYCGDRRTASYTNLAPGKYRFHVKASNNDGIWNQNGTSINVIIQPWFWQTPWFIVLCILTTIAGIVITFRLRIRSTRLRNLHLESKIQNKTRELTLALKHLKDQKEKIDTQNSELLQHRVNLEDMVKERTHELEEAKRRAEDSERLKDSFLANMSHEIRTPMNAIMGFIEIIRHTRLEPDELEHYLEIIERNGDALLVLIDDILDLSRLESGNVKIHLEPCLISDLIQDLHEQHENSIRNTHQDRVKLLLDYPRAQRLSIDTDPTRLRQVLNNLLENATKFTEQGYIRLGYKVQRSQNDKGNITFFVEDSGIGIATESQQHIFSRFGKVEDCKKKLYPGTGLGLAITSKIVALLKGKISVQSTPGKGSRFEVTLPYKTKISIAKHSESYKPHLNTPERLKELQGQVRHLGPRKVLVAEDEDPNFLFIEKVLSMTQLDFRRVKDGDSAIRMHASFQPDLILMDIKMPGMDGLEAIRNIREKDTSTPIIAQTAFSMRSDINACMQMGANEFLSKPYSPQQLFEVILKILGPKDPAS